LVKDVIARPKVGEPGDVALALLHTEHTHALELRASGGHLIGNRLVSRILVEPLPNLLSQFLQLAEVHLHHVQLDELVAVLRRLLGLHVAAHPEVLAVEEDLLLVVVRVARRVDHLAVHVHLRHLRLRLALLRDLSRDLAALVLGRLGLVRSNANLGLLEQRRHLQ
jgi:hypothetical protein